MLKELISVETLEPTISTSWRASQVGMCETLLCHKHLGHEALSISGRVKHLLNDGVTHEHDIVTRLVNKGIEVKHSCLDGQTDVCCSSDPYVPGHPDGVIRTPKWKFDLDYADENFKAGSFLLLEITAPGHFPFLRLQKQHARVALYVKYVQIQLYLNSPEIRSYSNCALLIAKNKNTSMLYEEGISLDEVLVQQELDKLRHIKEITSSGKVSNYRCDDWRRNTCQYRQLCFANVLSTEYVSYSSDILKGESLKEAKMLAEVAEAWHRGKLLKGESDDLIEDAREQFREIIEDYGARGLTLGDVKALMIDSTSHSTNYEVLKRKYPEAYGEVVTTTPKRYVRVT